MNIAIVVSEFNKEVTSRMLSVAQEKANLMKLKIIYTCKVPGAFDMPIIVDALLKKKNVDGIVTLGAIIKGQTKHDEVISHSTAKSLIDLSIKYQKPVSFGISGPGMQKRHAYARIRPVAERAVEAVVKISEELQRIQK
ncbi:6,7-dimethyl-8-ribityllumazine synthase [Marine Group I thaumarchaeote]|uniref:6,7-dimethyl-8-ribityllumazine synthase n=1 Tax=Marine Group I thaumarchaeote TaxID=2511932 RepID=A0A7K4MSA1_9ARCH|nr:MAG: 6,7-dimethyl-8-ribityllumazine synthase [Nitrosopumilus sp. YT1]KPU81562.1 riboflavin synthase subunit beta [Nitrosopumilus sp. PRT-SC01]NMI82945.1 6,7-dimethyl-8-ribityllumazine synthase [Candidatus Nitrosopumilus sp. MTA1]NWJ20028.1 6,7-dimethyl-8-ribityllumazine synthase [Marine Group I thaumarchaeote]NWJ27939.1 6,7-dimethyl-8-ribityllumazine synthase [Marine Group I thaumarchaeote]